MLTVPKNPSCRVSLGVVDAYRERPTWTLTQAQAALACGGSGHSAAVEIEGKPLDILLELLRHAGEVVTKGELIEAVWPGVTVAEGSLTTAMSKLRRAIGDVADSVIVTVPRIGYRLTGPVAVRRV